MTGQPSLAVKRFGTEEPVPERPILRAGALTAMLEAGNLRYVAFDGVEAIRAIAFVARDRSWATYAPRIENLSVEQDDDRFVVGYDATCADDAQALRYRARIEGRADGSLRFAVDGAPLTDWVTNRTGFVVLHGVEGVAGAPVTVRHTDGTVERARFPELIKPDQPFFDIGALTHEPAPGLTVTCTLAGDAYEMEDQRNWTDASFKTYIRPLAKPWPYTMPKGERFEQAVALSIEGAVGARAAAARAPTVEVGDGDGGRVPAIGLAVAPERAGPAAAAAALLRRLAPQHLVCHFDPEAGHGAADMARFRQLGEATAAALVLEAVVPCRSSDGAFTDDPAVLRADVARIAAAATEAGAAFGAVVLSPAADLKSYQPTGPWPKAPSPEAVFAAARAAFPGAAIGGGMLSYFTELNRKRPPAAALDFLTHSTSPIVHAADDLSVMESLEALPSVMRSAKAIAGGKPYRIGPSAIGMRMNPYGAAPLDNPHNRRVAMARVDPRQRGLFNAAWTLGYIAHAARLGVDAVTLSAPVGEFGAIHRPMPWPQPWFDEAGDRAQVYPVYHVLSRLAEIAGARVVASRSTAPGEIHCLACQGPAGTRLWLANTADRVREVSIAGLRGARAHAHVIDDDSFELLCADPEGFDRVVRDVALDRVVLGPYAVCRIDVAA